MGLDAVIVIAVVVGIIGLLALTRIAPDAIMVAGLTALLAVPLPVDGGWRVGVLTVKQGMEGFGNDGVATVGVLFAVVVGLRETGGVDFVAQRLLGRPRSTRGAIARTVFPVMGMSVFLNNTPVVAMMVPAVQDWSRKLKISASKLMIPVSYAAILGGTCSLIGTSTNLVVAGLVIAQTDMAPLKMFDITWVGLPCTIVGAVYLIVFGPRLLPDRKSSSGVLSDPREYTTELIVPAGSPLGGKTVEQAGLRNMPGGYLVEIERGGEIIGAVAPEQVLRAGDRLLFAGVVESIREVANTRGLAPATDQIFKLDAPRHRRRLFEAVVAPSSPMEGKSIREGRFRNRYNGAVIAVARNGERLTGKIGDIMLAPGDTLLLEADPSFAERHRNSRDFLLVSALEDSAPRRHEKAPLALGVLALMVAAAAFEVVPMLVAALLAAGAMILTRCCTISEARRSIDWSVLILIGASLGIGRAMDTSGAAASIAGGMLSVAGANPWWALIAIYAVTSLINEFISNNAAVALIFPIALATADSLGVDFMPFVIAIMMAGSASFASPIGYQTNLMVYGPGGYRFTDFVKIGLPLNVLVGVTAVAITPLVFPF